MEVRPGEKLTSLAADGAGFTLRTDRAELRADLVVAGLGILPNDGLAAAAGLAVEDGIVVDETLRTADPAVFAAGDVARFPSARARTFDPRRARGQREPHGQGGRPRDGRGRRRLPAPAVLLLGPLRPRVRGGRRCSIPRLEVVADWKEPYRKGVVYYLADGRVRGVLAWGIFGQMDAARALIAEPGPHDPGALRGEDRVTPDVSWTAERRAARSRE